MPLNKDVSPSSASLHVLMKLSNYWRLNEIQFRKKQQSETSLQCLSVIKSLRTHLLYVCVSAFCCYTFSISVFLCVCVSCPPVNPPIIAVNQTLQTHKQTQRLRSRSPLRNPQHPKTPEHTHGATPQPSATQRPRHSGWKAPVRAAE